MHLDDKGQLFSSAGPGPAEGSAGSALLSYQPAHALPGEGAEYDALTFDMGAAGFEPIDWARPKEDLRFTIRQPTLPELCRGLRLLPEGGTGNDYARLMLTITVCRIGDRVPTEEEVGRWLDDLRLAGSELVALAGIRVNTPSDAADKAFTDSRRYDPSQRRYGYRLPREIMPQKSDIAAGELAFTMRELTFREVQAAADASDDPDDAYSIRALKVMWSIASIGDRNLSLSPEDLAFRRRWIAKIGHKAWLLLVGTWTRMHELDRGLVDRFLGAAVAPA